MIFFANWTAFLMPWLSTMTVFQVFICGSFQFAKTFQVYQLSKCDSTKVQLLRKCSSFLNVKACKLSHFYFRMWKLTNGTACKPLFNFVCECYKICSRDFRLYLHLCGCGLDCASNRRLTGLQAVPKPPTGDAVWLQAEAMPALDIVPASCTYAC
jgi:hypothetical protein